MVANDIPTYRESLDDIGVEGSRSRTVLYNWQGEPIF